MSRSISINFPNTRDEMEPLFDKLQRAASTTLLNSGALAIGTAKAKVLIANTIYAYCEGVLVKKTTAEIVLSGTVAADLFNVYVLSINSAGTVSAQMGTAGVSFPVKLTVR